MLPKKSGLAWAACPEVVDVVSLHVLMVKHIKDKMVTLVFITNGFQLVLKFDIDQSKAEIGQKK
jgi:hypothetical protein